MNIKRSFIIFYLVIFVFFIAGSMGYAQKSGSRSTIDDALDFFEQVQIEDPKPRAYSGEVFSARNVNEINQVSRSNRRASESVMLDALELKDMDIVDVLKLISKKSGLNIVAGKNVRGKVTIYLKDVNVRDALQIILDSNDLAYVEEDGIVKVLTAQDFQQIYGYKFGQETETKLIQLEYVKAEEIVPVLTQMKSQIGLVTFDSKSNTLIITDRPEKISLMREVIQRADIPLSTRVFSLRYSKADEVAGKIQNLLTKNVGKLEFDERSNKIFVTETKEKIDEIISMIKAFDEKHPEVLIEAKILQITLSNDYKMGIDWEAVVSDFHTLDFKSTFSSLTSADKGGRLSIGTIANDDYSVLIEALETIGKTNILSSPRIAVINNEEAKILVGASEPYVTSETVTTASGPTTTSETVNFIEVGVKLFVTPTIHGDGYVTMKIKPEVSSLTGYVTTSTNNKIPTVETSEAETTVMVKDGVTIIIGGLIKEQDIRTVNKVPLLGDIPFLGPIFRNESKEIEKTEIVIFLTPRIITGDVLSEEDIFGK
ncbi:MAG: secretin N-terminal domain-containing protein [Candidatus Omnitrophica bacterium]|nr:secretin N-terminal domain-containing protein [Candidatus Omnitrophota bacterium]